MGGLRRVFLAAGFTAWLLALVGASCDRKSAAEPSIDKGDKGDKGGDKTSEKATAEPTSVHEALPGLDTSKLTADKKARFFKLVDKLSSPCGKAHSLRTSLKSDSACKRATFAARTLLRRLGDELTDEEIVALYTNHYDAKKTVEFELGGTPFLGVPTASVVLVEFFDYGCPHCKLFAPMLEEALADFPSEAVLYYKNFPLSNHADSIPAAIAAQCAQRQGKFRDMHRKLFANQEHHGREDLTRFAKDIGLDMAKFEADFQDPKMRERVMRDKDEGQKAEIVGTPALFINGRLFTDPMSTGDIVDWIKEEQAVAH